MRQIFTKPPFNFPQVSKAYKAARINAGIIGNSANTTSKTGAITATQEYQGASPEVAPGVEAHALTFDDFARLKAILAKTNVTIKETTSAIMPNVMIRSMRSLKQTRLLIKT